MHALEMEMATHSSILAWRMPGTEEPGGLLSMGAGVQPRWIQGIRSGDGVGEDQETTA